MTTAERSSPAPPPGDWGQNVHLEGEIASGRAAAHLVLGSWAHQHRELGRHATRVAELARAVGGRLRFTQAELEEVVCAAELHDVGKLVVPADVLEKPGPLDDGEGELLRRHTLVGERMLSSMPAFAGVARLVRSSHERWDGLGYPDGLMGEEIPLGSRVIFACDAFDAMTSSRPYQRSRTAGEAVEELERCAGAQFDPSVAGILAEVVAHARAGAGRNARSGELLGRRWARGALRVRSRVPGGGNLRRALRVPSRALDRDQGFRARLSTGS